MRSRLSWLRSPYPTNSYSLKLVPCPTPMSRRPPERLSRRASPGASPVGWRGGGRRTVEAAAGKIVEEGQLGGDPDGMAEGELDDREADPDPRRARGHHAGEGDGVA